MIINNEGLIKWWSFSVCPCPACVRLSMIDSALSRFPQPLKIASPSKSTKLAPRRHSKGIKRDVRWPFLLCPNFRFLALMWLELLTRVMGFGSYRGICSNLAWKRGRIISQIPTLIVMSTTSSRLRTHCDGVPTGQDCMFVTLFPSSSRGAFAL
jgi:hypothetical protein